MNMHYSFLQWLNELNIYNEWNLPVPVSPSRVLMVLGAGRGPLVNASLRAAKQADRKLRVYAVEKNPNAVVTWVTIILFVLFLHNHDYI